MRQARLLLCSSLLLATPTSARALQATARTASPTRTIDPFGVPAIEFFDPGIPHSGFVSEAGPVSLFGVGEALVAEDLNGDADLEDEVLHVYDARTDRLTNLGWVEQQGPTLFRWVGADVCAFLVYEAEQGADLDGDGFHLSEVIQLFLPSTETLVNTGVASNSATASDGIESASGFVEGAIFPFVDTSLNLFAYETLGGTVLPFADGFAFEAAGDSLYYAAVPGGFKVYDTGTGATTVLSGIAPWYYVASPDLAITYDLGPPDGFGGWVHPIRIHDRELGTTVSPGLSGPSTSYLVSSAVVRIDTILFNVWEANSNADFNGDGDFEDYVLHVYDRATGSVFNTQFWNPFSSVQAEDWKRKIIVSASPVRLFDMDTLTLTDTGVGGGSTRWAHTRGRIALTSSSAVEIYDIDTGSVLDLGLQTDGIRRPTPGGTSSRSPRTKRPEERTTTATATWTTTWFSSTA